MGKWAAIDLRICTDSRNLPYQADPENDVHPMIWLSQNPEAIDSIPELQRDDNLKALILAVNGVGHRFETFRCASALSSTEGVYVSMFGVGLIYRDRGAFQQYPAQLMVAGEILGFVADSDTFPSESRPFAVEIHRVYLKEEDFHGWTVDVWHESRSASEVEAQSLYGEALGFLASVLAPRRS